MLSKLLLLAAGLEQSEIQVLEEEAKKPLRLGDRNVLVIILCALAVGAVFFIWAFFIRKRPKRGRRTLVPDANLSASAEEQDNPQGRRRRKRRPKDSDNWGRNPTLSETGGLPPPRPEEPEPPPAAESSQTR